MKFEVVNLQIFRKKDLWEKMMLLSGISEIINIGWTRRKEDASFTTG